MLVWQSHETMDAGRDLNEGCGKLYSYDDMRARDLIGIIIRHISTADQLSTSTTTVHASLRRLRKQAN